MSQTATPFERQQDPSQGLFERVPGLILRAGRATFWPLADQAIVSLGNFLTLVIVARGLPDRSQYGTFGLVLECIFYFNTLQTAVITYPLTVRGASANAGELRRLATASLLMTCAGALPVALAGLGIASATHQAALGLAATAAFVAWQVQEVVRRSLMSHLRYGAAAWGDALRYLGTTACVGVLWHYGQLTLVRVFIVIALFTAAAVVVQALQVGLARITAADLKTLTRQFWIAGRWMLLSSLTAVITSLCGIWSVSFFHGNALVGEFYAIANFTKPVNLLIITFSGLMVQHAARAYAAPVNGLAAAQRAGLRLAAIACTLAVPYLLLLMAVPGPAMRLLYGAHSHFGDPTGLIALRIFSFGFILMVFMSLIGAFMNGIGRTRENFYAQVVSSSMMLLVTFPLTIRYGLIGLVTGGSITATTQLATMVYLLRRTISRHEHVPVADDRHSDV
jgi:O-antigen/teichoic acid export membrane protein